MAEGVLILEATGHQILREENLRQDGLGKDLPRGATHTEHLVQHHSLLDHDFDQSWDLFVHLLQVFRNPANLQVFFLEETEHVAHKQNDWLDLHFWQRWIGDLRDVRFYLRHRFKPLTQVELFFICHLHRLEFLGELQNARNALGFEVLVNELSNNFARVQINTANVLLAVVDPGHEEVRNDDDNDDEEGKQDLQLEILVVEPVR